MLGFNGNHMFEKGARPGRTVQSPFGSALMREKPPVHLTGTDPQELLFQLLADVEVLLSPGKATVAEPA
jgi:hypothetical protein